MKEITEQEEYIPFGEPAHYLQRDILVSLKESSGPASYSELKPIDLDGNAFNHHLKTLVEKGVVIKLKNNKYELTPKGKLGVDYYSLKDSRLKTRPVAGVFLLVISGDGKVLAYKSTGAPKDSHEGLLFGKLRLGQTYKQTVERMLFSRNLKEVNTTAICNINSRYLKEGELVAHRCGPLYLVRLERISKEIKDFGSSTSKISWKDPKEVESEELRTCLDLVKNRSAEPLDLELAV